LKIVMRPSVRQLEYALAVARERHFGRAARTCGVTQPALSTQIQALEEALGVQLFERSRRGVIVTPAGERALGRAQGALAALDALVEEARGADAALAGPLHLGVIPTVAPYLLPRWLPLVRDAYPELRLFLHEDQTARLLSRLREGALDLLLLALPVEGAGLESLLLFEEPFLLAAPAHHRLARGGRRRVAEGELEGAEVLLLEEGHCLRDQALSFCQRAGAREGELVRASSLSTLVQMVANGLGVTLLPALSLPVEVHAGDGIALRRFRPPEPSRSIGLVWRKSSARGAAFRHLGHLLRRYTPQG
jgi:LysR family hydrogen peroxide-inducible transcriptional activator